MTTCGRKDGKRCQKQGNEKKNTSELPKKTKLDNARRLRGIYCIDPADAEFKETVKKSVRRELEVPMPAAMPCKIRRGKYRESCRTSGTRKTTYSCIVEADKSTRKRLEGTLHKDHEDHIARKGVNSLNHSNLVHESIPMRQAIHLPDAKAAVDKEWEKLEKIPAWQLTKVRNKKEVIDEERKEGKTVHFASLMDICHLKSSELEPNFQKYKGRVVLRGDIVKDDSGSYAVFTEQGSSASQMTTAKVMDVIARLPGCAGQAADAVSAYTQVKMEVPQSDCLDIWIRPQKHKWPKSWSSIKDPVVPLERNLYGHAVAGTLW